MNEKLEELFDEISDIIELTRKYIDRAEKTKSGYDFNDARKKVYETQEYIKLIRKGLGK